MTLVKRGTHKSTGLIDMQTDLGGAPLCAIHPLSRLTSYVVYVTKSERVS